MGKKLKQLPPSRNLRFKAQELPAAVRGTKLFGERIISDLPEIYGFTNEPDLVLQRLSKSRDTLRLLTYDPEISAAIETRREALLAMPWRLEPTEGPVSTFIHDELAKVMTSLIYGAWEAVLYGYSVLEIVYEKRETKIGLAATIQKPFEWFRPMRDGSVRWFPPSGAGGIEGLELSPLKVLLTRSGASHANPYGEALLTRVYWAWFGGVQGNKFWLQFLERFGQPMLVGKTDGDREKLASALSMAVQDAAIAVDEGTDITALNPTGNGESFDKYLRYVAKQIQKVILGQTLTSDIGSSGSFAAARVHNEIREDRRNADARLITESAQKLVENLMVLNFPGAESPKFVLEDAQGLEEERAARDKTLREANPDLSFTPEYLKDTYGLSEEHFILKPAADTSDKTTSKDREEGKPKDKQEVKAAAGIEIPGELMSFASQPAPAGPFDYGQNQIEELVDTATKKTPQPIAVDKIREVIGKSESPEDLAMRLADLIDPEANAQDFMSVLERALYAADIIGYEAAKKDLER